MTFREKVYEIVRKIPKGRVMSYGQVAKMAGKPKAWRTVGMLMAKNPFIPEVPCHRVIAADGSLRGYSGKGGILAKGEMLLVEGVLFNGEFAQRQFLELRPSPEQI